MSPDNKYCKYESHSWTHLQFSIALKQEKGDHIKVYRHLSKEIKDIRNPVHEPLRSEGEPLLFQMFQMKRCQKISHT